MSDEEQEVSNEISIEDLELSLEVYEIESDQKLQKLKELFEEKKTLDLRQVFYEERSSLEVKFQNIVGDLTEFLINQEVPSTEKLRKTFYRILESPLLLLFKVSKFEIFNLRLNAFDIELEPIEAITELGKQLYKSIEEYTKFQKNIKQEYIGSVYESFEQFLEHAKINLIQDEIFTFYSYLRKGSAILKKKIEDKIKIVEIFNNIEEKLIFALLKNEDVKTLKELSTLNYEIYLLENNFDVLCFYLKIPLRNIYKEIFKELELLAAKSKQTCNYDMFINVFVKFNQEILNKLQIEKIEDSYVEYLEKVAIILLELWGVRVCQFREFFSFFKTLFEVHPDKKKLLEICLKHTPKLEKEDIALIRANYRQNVENKNTELISIMKKVSLDDINSELNSIYHQIFYNLDFSKLSKETLIELFTLVNGNSNIEGFIFTVEKAFKEWNHTIDFGNSVKFIETEFGFPKNLTSSQIIESLRLLTNLCILESKGFNKEFQELVAKGTVVKAMTGICKFLLSLEEERIKFIKETPICQLFCLESFRFLQNTLQQNSNEWEEILLSFANVIPSLKNEESQLKLQSEICKHIEANSDNYKLGGCVKNLKRVYEFNKKEEILKLIADIFMGETVEKSIETKKFRFFGKNINKLSNELISKCESDFLMKYACIKENIIEVKEPSCFKLSELEVITNPIQFEKAMDNYYFTLNSNAKRFIQFIVEEWSTDSSTNHEFFSSLISLLIQNHSVGIPILCNIRIKPNENSKEPLQFRFVEYLVNKLTEKQASEVKKILTLIINCETIKYRNGKDYIIEEVVPMITKRALTLINAGNLGTKANNILTLELYEVLALCLEKFKLTDLKIDTIQKTLLKINYEIRLLNCEKSVARLSQCYDRIIKVFFRKKELDIKKKGLEEAYEKIVWNEIRTYNRLSNNTAQKKPVDSQQPLITEQIMVSPFTLSQEFNNEEYKVKKSEQEKTGKSVVEEQSIKFSEIAQSISVSESQISSLKSFEKNTSNQTKEIDLSKMKYNIEFYLGKSELLNLETKENWNIKQRNQSKESIVQSEGIEKSITFVQYYMREMSLPEVSEEVALKYILAYLKSEIEISLIWSNPQNLEKLFVPLVILFDFMTENNKKPEFSPELKGESSVWKEIIEFVNANSIQSLKRIFSLLSELGYNNLWSENYKNFPSYSNLIKSLNLKVIDEESFLSIVLKRSLEFNSLSEIKQEIDTLFDKIFTTRPTDQTSLMYKVGIDKNLLNLIMKSLEIKNLSNISFLFHSNFNNLRLYTDQLHEGLKALNMASKTRSYNEYIQLAKEIDDEEFFGPMKLFQENFKFFIKIEREGYNFKKAEEVKLCLERLTNILRGYSPEQKENICKECDKLIEQYLEEVEKIEFSIANRVKSFYLVTKLRDLSYQNSISINLINEILREKKVSSQEILEQVKRVDIFSLLMTLHRELVRFDLSWNNTSFFERYNTVDQTFITKQINFCTTRRFSHSMNSIYEKCDLELDEVIQRCLDQLKLFFSTSEGQMYLEENHEILYPGFFVKSFIQAEEKNSENLKKLIRSSLEKSDENLSPLIITIKKGEFLTDCISQFREINSKLFYNPKLISINYEGQSLALEKYLETLAAALIKSETLVWTKSKDSQYLTFNKYKTSEATLEEVELLGYLVGYCIYHKISLLKGEQEVLPLQSSIIAAFSFNIIDIEDLLHADFKIWEDVKKILSIEDSKTLNLNFSYIFENTKTLQQERIELVDKGASKKVNNLNRDEFCDAIACHVLYNNIKPQISRFIQGILSIVPKELLSNLKNSEVYPIFYNKEFYDEERENVGKVMKKYMKKIGVITPEVVIRDGKRIENLRDYQNIEWATELILENSKLREKLWPNETNIFVLTTIGPKPRLTFGNQTLIIEHFETKESMSSALKEFC